MVVRVPRRVLKTGLSALHLRGIVVPARQRLSCSMFILGTYLVAAGGGCSAPVRTVSPTTDPNTLGETGFVHYLSATTVVTVDEGTRGVLALVGDANATGDFAGRWAALRERGGAQDEWRVTGNTILNRGTFAYMLCGVLGVPRGLNDNLSGSLGWGGRRAASRTAAFEGLLDYGPSHEPISGAVVTSSLVRAEQWLDRRNGSGP